METTSISIVIPTVNRLALLQRALESALAQTTPVAVLVSDNGSSDGTWEYLQALQHPNLRTRRIDNTISSQEHASSLQAWVETEWSVFLSDDDFLEPDFITQILSRGEASPKSKIIYSQAVVHLWDHHYTSRAGPLEEAGWAFMLAFLAGKREPCWCAMAVHMPTLRSIGNQPQNRHIGDMYYWIRMLSQGRVAFVPAPLSNYIYIRKEPDSTTSGIPLIAWYRECCIQADEMIAIIEAQGDSSVPSRKDLVRLGRDFVARSCSNQILWNRIRNRPFIPLLSDALGCAPLFIRCPMVWHRVLGGLFLPKPLIRATVIAFLERRSQ